MEYTKEQIEKMAEEYAEEQNSAYTNDYYGFIAGFEKALSLFAVSGRSEQFYCVSSSSLVHGKPCEKWCGDKNCKILCKQ